MQEIRIPDNMKIPEWMAIAGERIYMIILGIDPGLQSTGFGAIKGDKRRPALIRAGYIKTSPKAHISSRLFQIYSDTNTLIKETEPDLVAIENVFSLVRYPRAGILLGSVIGVIYLSVFQQNLSVIEITPKEVKNALVGYGNANKSQIRETIQKELNMPEGSSFHAADALAVALTAFYRKTSWRT
ncbi:MAG TPA: crossover junction endodeoxyribonuclease [Deltaproteobacteria bacterium]|nr:crossover junction endodeoxyribonuclease [Deltaproteobacteria bacterium]